MSREHFIHEDPFQLRARGIDHAAPGQSSPRQGPWSNNPQLGQSQPFVPSAANRQSILKMDEWGMPEVWSVMLGIELGDESALPPTADLDLKAVVLLGAGGTTQKVVIDWKQGVSFSAPMNALEVIAEYATVVDVTDDLRLTVTLGKGQMCRNNPTFTTLSQFIPAADSRSFDIPAFADSFGASGIGSLGVGPYSALTFYNFMSLGGTTLGQITGANLLTMGALTEIPNATASINVYNGNAFSLTERLIFDLAL